MPFRSGGRELQAVPGMHEEQMELSLPLQQPSALHTLTAGVQPSVNVPFTKGQFLLQLQPAGHRIQY